jgi:hypothetical protein
MIYKIKELSFVEPVNQNGQITTTILKGKEVFGILIFKDKFTLLKNTEIREDYENELKVIKTYIKGKNGYTAEVGLNAKIGLDIMKYDKDGNQTVKHVEYEKRI